MPLRRENRKNTFFFDFLDRNKKGIFSRIEKRENRNE